MSIADVTGKSVLRNSIRIVVSLLMSSVIGLGLLLLVYSIPTEKIEENVRVSSKIIETETQYPQLVSGWETTQLDNWTDSVMMLIASHPVNTSLLEAATANFRYQVVDKNPAESIVIIHKEENPNIFEVNYSRYWHGYLIWLKPLLYIMNYSQIRVINTICQILLIIAMLAVLSVKHLRRIIIPYLAMLCFLTPPALFCSMQFSSIFYISMISSIILICCYDRLEKKKLFPLFFLFIGIITAYFDFLTYPIITICMPLTLFLIMSKPDNWKTTLKWMLIIGLYWGIGYIGMWGLKFLLGTLFSHSNTIESSSTSITMHLGLQEGMSVMQRLAVIMRNGKLYKHWPYFAVAAVSTITCFGYAVRQHTWREIFNPYKTLALLLVAILPFIWIFLTAEHAFIHFWFTHRNLAVVVFTMLCLIVQSPKQGKPVQEK